MKSNLNVASLAVVKNGLLLVHVHYSVRNNREIVKKAVNQNGLALEHCSSDLKRDLEIAVLAMRSKPAAKQHVPLFTEKKYIFFEKSPSHVVI